MLKKEEIADVYTLSPVQEGMLFHILADPESKMYWELEICFLRGELDAEALRNAWREVIARHEALRTSFHWQNLSKPVQAVHKKIDLRFETLDWTKFSEAEVKTKFDKILIDEQEKYIDLSSAPLMRLTLICLSGDCFRLVWGVHHLIHDAWSLTTILHEVFEFYESFAAEQTIELGEPVQYRDYIFWLKNKDLGEAEVFWKGELENYLPNKTNGVRQEMNTKAKKDAVYGREEIYLDAEFSGEIYRMTRENRVSVSSLTQSAWSLILLYESGIEEVCFGVTAAGRPAELVGADEIVGNFFNTLPMCLKINKNEKFDALLREIHTRQMRRSAFEFVPLILIKNILNQSPEKEIFETIIVFQNAFRSVAGKKIGNIRLDAVKTIGHPNYPLTLRVTPAENFWIEMLYDARRFDKAIIRQRLKVFQSLLEQIVHRKDAEISELLQNLRDFERNEKEDFVNCRRENIGAKLKSIKPQTVKIQ